MSNITSIINVNVPKDVKEEATILFNDLGLNMSTAINIFLKKAISERGIPFEIKQQPNLDLIQALKEVEDMENGKLKKKSYHNIDEMFKDILNEKNSK